MTFEQRLKKLRLDSNMSQMQLSKKTGIAQSTLADYEKGANSPSSDKLIKIADAFNVSLDYLLCLTDVKERNSEKSIEMINFVRPEINGRPATDKELEMLTKMMGNLIDIFENYQHEE